MKILMTCETYLPSIGGAEVHVDNLLRQLKSEGHAVTLVTNEPGDESLGVVRIPWSKQALLKLFNTLFKESKGVDVIHAHYCYRMALIVSVIGRLRKIPVIITLHGMGILDHPGAGTVAQFWHNLYRFWSLQLSTHVISTSDDLAIVAEKYISRKKITVIFNGYNENLFFPRGGVEFKQRLGLEDKLVIMTVRRLVPKNGPHYLIEALPRILSKVTNTHYVVVGDGPLRGSMAERVSVLGISNHVTFLGKQSNELVPDLIAGADVVVFPSTAESSSIACAEAMAMQKAIVASRVGGLIELLGVKQERGWLVDLVPWTGSNYAAPEKLPAESYEALAAGVIEALVDKLSAKTVAAAKFAQNELSWPAVTEKTLKVYKKFS